MDFYEVLDQIIDLLRQRGRVSYQALKRQFDVDDAYLEDLKVELIEGQERARDHMRKRLCGLVSSSQPPSKPRFLQPQSGSPPLVPRAPRLHTPRRPWPKKSSLLALR